MTAAISQATTRITSRRSAGQISQVTANLVVKRNNEPLSAFGFRGVIAKPYEAAELGKIVHDVIESSHVNIIDYPG